MAALAALGLGLAACTGGSGLSLVGPKSEIAFAGSALTVVAPAGYCIDRNSLQQDASKGFVLISRCPGGGGKPPALIAVTTAPLAEGQTPPAPGVLAKASGGDAVAHSRKNGLSLVQVANGKPDMAGASPKRWRGAFAAGGQMVGMTLYAPPDSAALGSDGADLLGQIAGLSQAASRQSETPAAPPAVAAPDTATGASTEGTDVGVTETPGTDSFFKRLFDAPPGSS